MHVNTLRGLLYEFGIVLPEGHGVMLKRVQDDLPIAGEQARLLEEVVASVSRP